MESLLEVGKLVNTHGLRGEVKIVPWMDEPEDFERLGTVYLKTRNGNIKLTVKTVKYQKSNLIVKFAEFDDINDVECYKGCVLCAERDELGQLPDGVYYIADLIGLCVYTETGESVGIIEDVFNTGANDIYEIRREGKKNLLIPAIDDVVLAIDTDGGRVTVRIPEGLDE